MINAHMYMPVLSKSSQLQCPVYLSMCVRVYNVDATCVYVCACVSVSVCVCVCVCRGGSRIS